MRFLSRRSRVKGTRAPYDFRRPVCSQGHDANLMRREPEGWICLGCADEFLAEDQAGLGINELSRGGVLLPAGVSNPKPPSFREVMPNRRTRRRYK